MQNPIRTMADLVKYQVNRKDQLEVVRQSLYDFQQYPTAGVTGQLLFYQVPQGQAGKTFADTNMVLAGTLAAPQRFVIQVIELYFFPAANPSLAPGASAIDNFVNDVYLFYKATASVRLVIGSKIYVEEAAPMRFPPFAGFSGWSAIADATTLGANGFNRTTYATCIGRPYVVDPALLLEPTQNFSVSLNYPAAQAVSGNGRVGFVMDGILARNSQ